MNPDVQVREALRALAEQDHGRESQTPAGTIFARHFDNHPPVQRWKMSAVSTAVTLAAAAALILFLRPAAAPVVPQAAPNFVSEVAPEVQKVATVVAPAKPVRRLRRPEPAAEPREVVTEFYPLMDAPPPFERGQLLRVMVPASTMRSVGLPINPERWSERVQADVLVGEEGMARAIRFVSYEK